MTNAPAAPAVPVATTSRAQIFANIEAVAAGFDHSGSRYAETWNAGLRETIDRLAADLDTATA